MLDRYGSAGGGLLAGGLAYAALFALVPLVLLVAGVAGAFIADPATRASLVDTVSGVIPPLRDLATAALDEASRASAPVSILGLAALAWGASRFTVGLQDAIARVIGWPHRRGLIGSNVAAFGSVIVLAVAIVAAPVLAGLLTFLETGESVGIIGVIGSGVSLALGLVPIIGAVAAVGIVYRIVPLSPPRWRSLGPPAVVVGLILVALARLFVFVSPRLIGAAAILGSLASVFAALAWLSLTFQALLIGVAWTADRDDARSAAEAMPDAPGPSRSDDRSEPSQTT